MPEKKFNKLCLILFYLFFLFCLVLKPVQAQTLSNLDILYRLTDSAVVSLVQRLPADSKNVYLKTSLPGSYPVFENKVISLIRESKRNVRTISDSANSAVYFTIDNAKVNYPDMFRESLFGGYKIIRRIALNGSFVVSEKGTVMDSQKFSYSSEDTVSQNEIKELENPAFPFTKGELPPEPVFSTILEPVIALGTAAAVIYLFFSIRSK